MVGIGGVLGHPHDGDDDGDKYEFRLGDEYGTEGSNMHVTV